VKKEPGAKRCHVKCNNGFGCLDEPDTNEVGADGLCPLTQQPCQCKMKRAGHWCSASTPRTIIEAWRATMNLPPLEESEDE
jgi:hypothetical protein